jgi:hypothetical protein
MKSNRIMKQIMIACLILSVGSTALPVPAVAAPSPAVSITVGPTTIPGGNARGTGDITLRNDKLAVAFAVDTAPPWGVPRGGIIDIAEIRDGVISHDRASLLDFLPDSWSKWINANPRITIIRDSPEEAVVQTVRDWRGVEITSTYTLRAGQTALHVITKMNNTGADTRNGILSGYVLWPEGGHLFGPPGMHGESSGNSENALADWSAAYDEDWVMGLHAPDADRMEDDGRDRYRLHDLAPGMMREFETWLQVEASGSLAPLVATEIAFTKRPSGKISGRVSSSDGSAVDTPAIVAVKTTPDGEQPYAWSLGESGRYEFELPAGQYLLYATARGHSSSQAVAIDLSADQQLTQDFHDLGLPGQLSLHVLEKDSGRPLDARLVIEKGQKPLIGYFGKTTFFTELDPAGWLKLPLAPGAYTFKLSAAEGFTSKPVRLEVTVQPGSRQTLTAEISVLAQPAAKGWYSGDMHHHSDVLDGFTEPAFVMRSELAAGLDVTLLSDHDSVVNNPEMQRLATIRGVPFIAGTEISPSWAHFNAYPLDDGKDLDIDPGDSTVQEIFKAARRLGADVVQLNHPYQEGYGYFFTDERGEIPGGYSDDFDLVEITAADLAGNTATIERTWKLWNQRQRSYLSAGSDVHDVWQNVSGAARMMVRVKGELTVERFVSALRRGHAYATTGPLVYPEQMFGEEIVQGPDTLLNLGYSVQAVNGLVSVKLIEQGREIRSKVFDHNEELTAVTFEVVPPADTWYSLVVEDAAGKFLLTNPVWVHVTKAAEPVSTANN